MPQINCATRCFIAFGYRSDLIPNMFCFDCIVSSFHALLRVNQAYKAIIRRMMRLINSMSSLIEMESLTCCKWKTQSGVLYRRKLF